MCVVFKFCGEVLGAFGGNSEENAIERQYKALKNIYVSLFVDKKSLIYSIFDEEMLNYMIFR